MLQLFHIVYKLPSQTDSHYMLSVSIWVIQFNLDIFSKLFYTCFVKIPNDFEEKPINVYLFKFSFNFWTGKTKNWHSGSAYLCHSLSERDLFYIFINANISAPWGNPQSNSNLHIVSLRGEQFARLTIWHCIFDYLKRYIHYTYHILPSNMYWLF